MTMTGGVVQIHSAPSALCPHIEWALGGVLGVPAGLTWTPQPAERGSYRAEAQWRGPVGSAARLASAMRRWDRLRFEVTEDATDDAEGERYSFTPTLGVFHANTSRSGDLLIHEQVLRSVLMLPDAAQRAALERAMGQPWDAELDVFRAATHDDGGGVRWLHRVG